LANVKKNYGNERELQNERKKGNLIEKRVGMELNVFQL